MYVHDLDPFILEFDFLGLPGVGLRWYGLAYLATFFVGYLITLYMARKNFIRLPESKVGDFVTVVAIATMVGGRLGYCLFYAPETLTRFSASFPFWGVLEIHKGGMASHGGILGIFFVCFWYGWKHRLSSLSFIDIAATTGALGIFFGRMANFINGELFGREATPGDFAVKFPTELHYWTGYHPDKLQQLTPVVEAVTKIPELAAKTEVTAAAWEGLSFGYKLNHLAKSQVNQFIDLVIWASQNGFNTVNQALEPILTARYPSQIYQGLMEGLFIFFVCVIIARTPQKPGVIGAVFGVLYCIMRVIGEQFRMPDAHIGFDVLGLSRGQWLSIGMIVIAIGYLGFTLVRKDNKVGGWQKDRALTVKN